MLNMIKSIIQEKTAFKENAELILEGTMPNGALDDAIVLGEEVNDFDFDALTEAGEEPEVDMGDVGTESDDDAEGEEEPHEEPDGDEVPGGEPDGDEDDIMNASIDDADTDADAARNPEPIDTGVDGNEDDIMNQPVDMDDTLPTPVGAQTDEPVNDDNDILSMTIDMGSNTPSDILPVPPASAADAVPDDSDDIMNQRVDSGFSGETNVTPQLATSGQFAAYGDASDEQLAAARGPIDSGEESSNDEDDAKTEAFCQFVKDMRQKAFMEEISLGGDDSAPADDTAEAPAEDASADVSADTGDSAPSEEESPVTTAVKDKVAEADAADDVTTAATATTQQEVMNKLSNITKNLEDVKKSIMQSMQQ